MAAAAASEILRLLVLSSRARNKSAIKGSLRGPEIIVLEYDYDSSTLDEVLDAVAKILSGRKVASVALVLHSSERELFLTAAGEAKLSLSSIVKDGDVNSFLGRLVAACLDLDDWSSRVDFLATYMAEQVDGGFLAKELEAMLACHVGLSKSLEGSDIQVLRPTNGTKFLSVGEMYFDLPRLNNMLEQIGKVTKDGEKKLAL